MTDRGDDRTHTDRHEQERPLSGTEARQARLGRPVLIALISGIIIAMLIWIPVEWWGNETAPSEENAVRQAYPESSVGPDAEN